MSRIRSIRNGCSQEGVEGGNERWWQPEGAEGREGSLMAARRCRGLGMSVDSSEKGDEQ